MFDSVYGPLYTGGVALMTRTQHALIFIVTHVHLHTRFYPLLSYYIPGLPLRVPTSERINCVVNSVLFYLLCHRIHPFYVFSHAIRSFRSKQTC